VPPPRDPADFPSWFEANRTAAATWLFIPQTTEAKVHVDAQRRVLIETPETWIRITPFHRSWYWVEPPAGSAPATSGGRAAALLSRYRLLVIPGDIAGFAIDAMERAGNPTAESLPETSLQTDKNGATYRSLLGDEIHLAYRGEALRPGARINGRDVDWDQWAGGGVYESPYLRIRDGLLWISDGAEAYEMDCSGPVPVWRNARP
jgi:hypothetical protein